MIKNRHVTSLEGQKWSIVSEISPGTGSGNSWTFLTNGRFTEIDWYSGGAYWVHHYTGTYFYDADNNNIFMKYDKHPYLKNAVKKLLSLKITKNDTILTVINGWKKTKEIPSNNKQSLKIHDTVFNKYTFKIEK